MDFRDAFRNAAETSPVLLRGHRRREAAFVRSRGTSRTHSASSSRHSAPFPWERYFFLSLFLTFREREREKENSRSSLGSVRGTRANMRSRPVLMLRISSGTIWLTLSLYLSCALTLSLSRRLSSFWHEVSSSAPRAPRLRTSF